MRISDWSSDVCSSDLIHIRFSNGQYPQACMESVRAECYFQYDPEAIRDQPPRRGSWIKYWRAIVDSNHITSLHHITICTGTAQGDIDFFVKILGHRFVKQIGRASCRERVWRYV